MSSSSCTRRFGQRGEDRGPDRRGGDRHADHHRGQGDQVRAERQHHAAGSRPRRRPSARRACGRSGRRTRRRAARRRPRPGRRRSSRRTRPASSGCGRRPPGRSRRTRAARRTCRAPGRRRAGGWRSPWETTCECRRVESGRLDGEPWGWAVRLASFRRSAGVVPGADDGPLIQRYTHRPDSRAALSRCRPGGRRPGMMRSRCRSACSCTRCARPAPRISMAPSPPSPAWAMPASSRGTCTTAPRPTGSACSTRTASSTCGWHVQLDRLEREPEAVVEDARALELHAGHRAVGASWPDTLAGVDEVVGRIARVAERLGADGIAVGFHNHGRELEPREGVTPLERLAAVPGLFLQLDVGWAYRGGADPVALLREHAGRCPTIHMKDEAGRDGPSRAVGEGVVPVRRGRRGRPRARAPSGSSSSRRTSRTRPRSRPSTAATRACR